ncbi:uncharacterized protein GIQ15_06771 [Arthroderma uncinatum]|uniref:uncharacterized protein n=1 Tax=Arthroderma uncinatum TaxID=74035 RepID=UPI00144AEB67|nr:uncharacterized protein GIQ15_06771 [Arthroderma uncinatum]KAF3479795.1 hypothetical protein GIQ15_06771 [Arthroderma uncinatum]
MSFFEQYTSSSSSSPALLPRPQTSSQPSTSQWYHEQILRELPFMSTSTSRSGSPSRTRNNVGTQSPKRLSVLGLRSRSNTGNSNTSSSISPASSMTSSGEQSSKRSSHDGSKGAFDFVLPLEKEESSGKSFFSRGNRILRRQGSKFNLSDTLTVDEEDEMSSDQVWYGEKEKEREKQKSKRERPAVLRRMHRQRNSDAHATLKSSISEPFHFQHITHTSRGQLPPIELTHPHDLATEFSIIRASQRPNSELKGIHAQNLSYRPYTAEEESDWSLDTLAPDAPSLFTRSPPGSPISTIHVSPESRPLRRTSHSVENFSRPVSRIVRQPFAPTMIPPPRRSSRMATNPEYARRANNSVDGLMGLNGLSLSPVEDAPVEDAVGYAVSPLEPEPVAEPAEEIGRAFSPDEHNASSTKPSPLIRLDGVPEEDENSSVRSSHVIAFDPTPYQSEPEPEARSESKKPTILLAPLQETRFDYEDMHSPVIPSHRQGNSPLPAGPNSPAEAVGMHASNASWEADIDYCYEHAAESNSNFDWHRSSAEEQRDCKYSPHDEGDNSGRFKTDSGSFYLHPLDTSKSGQTTPELQPSSGLSASTRADSETASPAIFNHSFGIFPPTNDSVDKKPRTSEIQVLETHFEHVSHDSVYTHVISDIHEDDEYHIDEPAYSRTGSSTLSKCNSQESMMLSRAASIVRKHRSSTSTNSVPDLIHSPNCSREMVDREAPSSPLADKPVMPRPSASPVYSRSLPFGREGVHRMPFASVSGIDPTAIPSIPMHDRSKSASVLESSDCPGARATRKRSSTLTRGGVRKNRPSYSLFPVAGAPAPRVS